MASGCCLPASDLLCAELRRVGEALSESSLDLLHLSDLSRSGGAADVRYASWDVAWLRAVDATPVEALSCLHIGSAVAEASVAILADLELEGLKPVCSFRGHG